jgi:integrase
MARRRKAHYGDGSVYEYPKGSGRWFAAVPDGHGKTTSRRASSREEAETIRASLLKQRSIGLDTKQAGQTFAQFVEEWWKRGIEPKGLAPKTLEDYRDTIGGHLLPRLGSYRLYEFSVPLVLDVFAAISKERSESVALHAMAKLSMILNAAVRWRVMDRNYVADARPDLPKAKRQVATPLTIEQSWKLLNLVAPLRFALLYRMALLYGLRIGELLGFQWGDVDWQEKTITVRRQTQEVDGRKRSKDGAKSAAGDRVLPLTKGTETALLALWETRGDCLYIFPSDHATAWSPSNFERHWRGGWGGSRRKDGTKIMTAGIRNKAGLKGYKFHWLRHTCSTSLMELGCPEEVRAGILGHGKKNVTQHYSHARLNAMRHWLELWDAELMKGVEQSNIAKR